MCISVSAANYLYEYSKSNCIIDLTINTFIDSNVFFNVKYIYSIFNINSMVC